MPMSRGTPASPAGPPRLCWDVPGGPNAVTAAEYIVTLALTPAQSERFVFATEFGHVRLASEPATVADDGTQIVTLRNVFTVVK